MKVRILLAFLLSLLFFPINSLQAQTEKDEFKKILGQWVRPDGGYVLIIKNVRFDGSIEAVYLNPNKINVSKANVKAESGKINIFVELRDVGYPGSYYTLTYDKDTDRLVGVYHHLGINQNFDVHFMRKKTTKEEINEKNIQRTTIPFSDHRSIDLCYLLSDKQR